MKTVVEDLKIPARTAGSNSRVMSVIPKLILSFAIIHLLILLEPYIAAVIEVNKFPPSAELYVVGAHNAIGATDVHRRQLERTKSEPLVALSTDPSGVYEKYVVFGDKCRIKNYDHNDPTILKKYFSKKPKMCPVDAKPFIFYPDLNLTAGRSCVGFDKNVFGKFYKGDVKKWSCTYQEISRDSEHEIVDRHYKFGRKKALKAGDCPSDEFIWIECVRPGTNESYQQPMLLPLVKASRASIRPNNFGKKPMHVLVVGLDSVSRLNAYRQFPKTIELLRSKKNLIELFGYNKIGANSAPNQIPLLTGIPWNPPGLKSRIGSNHFDNVTRYLWEDYEQRGYRTMFYEEQWDCGLFLYPSFKGFKEAPTTYWPLPMIQAIDYSKLKEAGHGLCIGPDFSAKHYLDYTFNTMKILGHDRPLFSYSWLSEAAHDDINGGRRIDEDFHDFFTKMESSGILNNTAVLFISDHGFRFGAFRRTMQGGHEDMLPYGFILMPDWYYDEHPTALKNLQTNSRRLVTVYDLRATLLELSAFWDEGRVTRTANGYSLFSNEIPNDRNCEDANIDMQFCSCFEPHPEERNGALSHSLVEFVIENMNNVIREYNATDKCHTWSLDRVEDFVRLSEGDEMTDFYKLLIETKPHASFEVAAQLQVENRRWELLTVIDRTDWFSTHSKCVKRQPYERFCYCKENP